jgi:hypothetical protein
MNDPTTEHKNHPRPRLALEWAQLALTLVTLIGGAIYIGGRSEADQQQTRTLVQISSDLIALKERGADANTAIKVIAERVSQVEKRLERIEAKP